MKFHNFYVELVKKDLVPDSFLSFGKFMLPEGGYCSRNTQHNALIGKKLNLPFDNCLFEWITETEKLSICMHARHVKVISKETGDILETIGLQAYFKNPVNNIWKMYPPIFIVREPWSLGIVDGRHLVNVKYEDIKYNGKSELVSALFSPILEVLNILSCANVKTERHPKRRHPVNALPMDDYWLLKVERKAKTYSAKGGTHRSPREHARRGHDHTYHTKNGPITLWLNDIIVNPGVGGVISKEYVIAKPKSEAMKSNSTIN